MKKMFVLGAGSMGAGIAQTGLQSGMAVTLCDTVGTQLEKARSSIQKAFERSVSKGRMTAEQRDGALARLTVTTETADAADADYIIEAIFENTEAKKAALAILSEASRPDALIGSNTSTISITALSAAVRDPSRFAGTHFFNPAPVMKLLEVVRGLETSEETVAAWLAFAALLGKTPIVSKDSAGFIANRIGCPMLNAAVNVFDSGIGTAEDVDNAMKLGWGFPMGPLALIDLIGVDIQLAIMEELYREFGEPYYKPAPLLRRMVAAGRLGQKSGRGFYDYSESN